MASLALLLAPGALFGVGLVLTRDEIVFPLTHVGVIGVAGILATMAGVGDWWYHASGLRVIGPRERRTELLALGAGGLPLFLLMAAASVLPHPRTLLLPVLGFVIVITLLIEHDERLYHTRCGRLETLFHRVLVGGQAIAWSAWAHWCFVERVADA